MKDTFRKAFVKSLPVMAGYIVLGIGFGILLRNAGYGVLWSLSMAVFVYAGSMQYVGVPLIAGGASVLTMIMTAFMVNARHLFYSTSMLSRYKDTGIYRPYLFFALTDETYTLLCDDPDDDLKLFLVSLFNHLYWIAGCVLGSVIGGSLPFSAKGIEFSMTALFLASFTEQWLTSENHTAALTGLLSTLLCLVLFGRNSFLIPSMILITLILTALRKRQEEDV